jgi:colanic acid/amylovoran biosynthesis protein
LPNILLINTNYSWNKGSAAQIASTVHALNQIELNLTFTLISECFELDDQPGRELGIHVVGSPMGKPFSKKAYISRLIELSDDVLRAAIWYAHDRAKIKIDRIMYDEVLRQYLKSDLIIDLSGDTLSDYGANSVYSIFHILIGLLLKKKTVVYSQSIGPFRRMTKPLAKFCLNRVDLIVVREKETEKFLRNMHLTNTKIKLAPDIAFLLNSSSKQRIDEILVEEKCAKQSGILIGIGPNELMDEKFKPKNGNYIDLMANVADDLIEKLNANILLISHVIIPKECLFDDDRFVSNRIFMKAKNKNKIKILSYDHSPEDLKGIIGTCDLFIGARMHSNIAALSRGVPTVAIGWSHKFYGIMKMLNQEKYFCPIQTVTYPELTAVINDAWENRDKIKKDLQSNMKEIEKSSMESIQLIKKLLEPPQSA